MKNPIANSAEMPNYAASPLDLLFSGEGCCVLNLLLNRIFLQTMEFFLNVFTEFSNQDATTAPTRHMWEFFELSSIHASVIYQIALIHWNYCINDSSARFIKKLPYKNANMAIRN